MTREEVLKQAVNTDCNNILLELPTSFGKTKIALEIMAKKVRPGDKILIVIPRNVLINNWKEEITKWGYKSYLPYITFVTYVSFPKKADHWDLVIFDECHHLSERCRESLEYFDIANSIFLSATVKRDFKAALFQFCKTLQVLKVNVKEATTEGILPDPRVFLIPMHLDNHTMDCQIIKNKSKGNPIVINYSERWKYKDVKNRKIIIRCTQQQYYNDISNLIEWYRKKTFSELFKNMFLRTSGERLKWLSDQKTQFVYHLLQLLKNERTLTFCNSILQTEVLGKYCINSKNGQSSTYLHQFNTGKINHITACNMLDEGVNLAQCRVGIYACLNSSERMIKQKLGRILRHEDPVIIIPFYVGTRDEEIVNKMCVDYNPQLITVINNIKDLNI